MDATLFLTLPAWLDARLRDCAEREATNRQGIVRRLLVRELGQPVER
ncbi:hypothetical protein [Mycobacterium riyadhense]|nr:hypothetical protein [Mycobacterium riyadhense]